MRHSKAGKAFTALVLETFRLNGRLLLAGDRIAGPLQLTSARWQVLGAIEEQSLSVAQIARKLGLARQNVQRLADSLQEEGFVSYAPNPRHARAKLLRLTSRGMRAVKALGEREVVWANRIASAVSAGQLELVVDAITKLRVRLDTDRAELN